MYAHNMFINRIVFDKSCALEESLSDPIDPLQSRAGKYTDFCRKKVVLFVKKIVFKY